MEEGQYEIEKKSNFQFSKTHAMSTGDVLESSDGLGEKSKILACKLWKVCIISWTHDAHCETWQWQHQAMGMFFFVWEAG